MSEHHSRAARLAARLTAAPVLALWLPAVTARLVPGSSPPAEFFSPPHLIWAVIVYGCGLLSAHELALFIHREPTRRGFWPRLMLFGAAYGVLVEGVMLKNLTSTDWTRLGPLADPQHGHLFGLNLTWGLLAVLHHAVMGLAVPLLLIELLRPEARGGSWLSPSRLRWVHGLFLAGIAFGALGSGAGGGSAYAAVMVLALWLFRQARGWDPRPPRPLPPLAPWRVGLAGIVVTVALLALASRAPLGPPNGFQPVRVGGIFLGLMLFCWCVAHRTARRVAGGWTERHHMALAAGVLAPWLLLTPLEASDAYHAESCGGMALAGLAGLWLLLHLSEGPRETAVQPPTSPSLLGSRTQP